jgi:rubrerythrin
MKKEISEEQTSECLKKCLIEAEGGENQMAQEPIQMQKYTCEKCGHIWIPRILERPVQCPKCKRTDWDKPSNENNGKQ